MAAAANSARDVAARTQAERAARATKEKGRIDINWARVNMQKATHEDEQDPEKRVFSQFLAPIYQLLLNKADSGEGGRLDVETQTLRMGSHNGIGLEDMYITSWTSLPPPEEGMGSNGWLDTHTVNNVVNLLDHLYPAKHVYFFPAILAQINDLLPVECNAQLDLARGMIVEKGWESTAHYASWLPPDVGSNTTLLVVGIWAASHFTCAALHLKEKRYVRYDSWPTGPHRNSKPVRIIEQLIEFLGYKGILPEGAELKTWKAEEGVCLKQLNDYDCGALMIDNIRRLMQGKWPLQPQDVDESATKVCRRLRAEFLEALYHQQQSVVKSTNRPPATTSTSTFQATGSAVGGKGLTGSASLKSSQAATLRTDGATVSSAIANAKAARAKRAAEAPIVPQKSLAAAMEFTTHVREMQAARQQQELEQAQQLAAEAALKDFATAKATAHELMYHSELLRTVPYLLPLLEHLLATQAEHVNPILCPWLGPARQLLPQLQQLAAEMRQLEEERTKRHHFNELAKLTQEELELEPASVQLWYAKMEVKQLQKQLDAKVGARLHAKAPFDPPASTVRNAQDLADQKESKLKYPTEFDHWISTKSPFMCLTDLEEGGDTVASMIESYRGELLKDRPTTEEELNEENEQLVPIAQLFAQVMRRLRDNYTHLGRICAKLQFAQYLPARVKLCSKIVEWEAAGELEMQLVLHLCQCNDDTGNDMRDVLNAKLSEIGSTVIMKNDKPITGKRVLNMIIAADNALGKELEKLSDEREVEWKAEMAMRDLYWEKKIAAPKPQQGCHFCPQGMCSLIVFDDGVSSCSDCMIRGNADCRVLCKVCQNNAGKGRKPRKDCLICSTRLIGEEPYRSQNADAGDGNDDDEDDQYQRGNGDDEWITLESLNYDFDSSTHEEFYFHHLHDMVESFEQEIHQGKKKRKLDNIRGIYEELVEADWEVQLNAANLLAQNMLQLGVDLLDDSLKDGETQAEDIPRKEVPNLMDM